MRKIILGILLPALMLLAVFAQSGLAQTSTNPLNFSKNYILSGGDYVVGGVGLRGLGDATGFATGTISIPDLNSVPATGVPTGADIVAAFIYWETVEKSHSAFDGQQGFFGPVNSDGSVRATPSPERSWGTEMLHPVGVPVAVRAHPAGRRPCGATARTSARFCLWMRTERFWLTASIK